LADLFILKLDGLIIPKTSKPLGRNYLEPKSNMAEWAFSAIALRKPSIHSGRLKPYNLDLMFQADRAEELACHKYKQLASIWVTSESAL